MILIVDDEKNIRSSLSGLLKDEGYDICAVESAEKAEEILHDRPVDLILLDIQMPGKDGITFLDDNSSRLGDIPVIIISGRSDIPTAVAAIKLGSFDFIEKPLVPERILMTIRQALRLSKSLQAEKKLVDRILDEHQMVGRSEPILHLRTVIEKAAATDSTILITGENGTGKEIVAHQIHNRSARRAEPMVTVNCPAIPEHLFESELFGHIKGAFTGALRDRTGRFEKADKGTLFLDEIGDLSLPLQGKLLRMLETGRFEKVGSDETISVDCRLIAATNRDLKQFISDSLFREDLYYRLKVIEIDLPPLRRRRGDIPILVDHFLKQIFTGEEYSFSSEAVGLMTTYDWPGNVRQLKNFLQQVTFCCEPGEISSADVERLYHNREPIEEHDMSGGDSRLAAAVRQFEIGYLSRIYQENNGNIAAMARELNMDRGNLSKKLKSLGIV